MTSDLKRQFPIFERYPDLIYFDNAATTQKPLSVINAISDFYTFENSNINRGVYDLSSNIYSKYESIRQKVADFLNAESANCISFTSGTTESINIIANSFLKPRLSKGHNIIVTLIEHHANLLPWQKVAKETGAELRLVALSDNFELDYLDFEEKIDSNTKMVAFTHVSNTLGTVTDVSRIKKLANKYDIPILIDAAQSAALQNINAAELGYDFLTFSGHKIFGPFGIGTLYVSPKYQKEVKPYNVGGGIVKHIDKFNAEYLDYPKNMDVGTPNISGVIGLGSAIHFLSNLDRANWSERISELGIYAINKLNELDEVDVLGKGTNNKGIVSFTIKNIHPHDAASFLNKDGIAARAGMHCTQPLHNYLNVTATIRFSFSIYNTKDEVDKAVLAVKNLINLWS